MPDNRKILQTVRMENGATFGPGDEDALDQAMDAEQVEYLTRMRAIEGTDWSGEGDGSGAARMRSAEPAGSPFGQDGPQRQSGQARPADFDGMTRAELEREMEARGLSTEDVKGSGKGGNVLNADLAAALQKHEEEQTRGGGEPDQGGEGEPNPPQGGDEGGK